MHRTLSVSICLSQRPHIGRFPFLITPTIAGLGHTEESATAYRGGAAGHRAAGGRARGSLPAGAGSSPPSVSGPGTGPSAAAGATVPRRVCVTPGLAAVAMETGGAWRGRHVPRGLRASSVPRCRFGLN